MTDAQKISDMETVKSCHARFITSSLLKPYRTETEQIGAAVMLHNCIWEISSSNPAHAISYPN
jgi:hypothetical protein